MIIAHYQDGPAQGRCEALREKEPPTYRDIPFFPPSLRPAPALALPGGVAPPPPKPEPITVRYRPIGGWTDKWGNQHVTYIPEEHELGYSPVTTLPT